MLRIIRFYYRNYRLLVYLIVFSLIIGVIIAFATIGKFIPMDLISGFGMFSGIIVLAVSLLSYLGDSTKKNIDNSIKAASDSISDYEVLNNRLKNIERNYSQQVDELKQTSNINIEELIKNTINKEIVSENFVNQINQNYPPQIDTQRKFTFLKDDLLEIRQRIDIEISRLSKSANLNLVVGTVTTLIAVIILGFEVLKNELKFTDVIALLSHYIPRITIVIFVEIFAFFFLKMYRNNLVDIKYFHNEKTNIELKIISLKAAIINANQDVLSSCIKHIVETERNFILNKDQSTIELEKEKIERVIDKNVIDALLNFVKSNK